MENGRHFIFPTDITEDADGNTIFSFKTLDANGITALVAFTRLKEQQKGPDTAAVSLFIHCMLEPFPEMAHIHGLILNSWSDSLYL